MDSQYKFGDYIEDRYLVTDVRAGGMGKVYISYDLALDQTVAVKTLNTEMHANRAGQGFLNEAQTWILLEDHPHIVQAKSSFMVRDQPFLVIEYVDGGDLRGLLRKRRMNVQTALKFAIQFCSAAEYANRKLGLIHRDIKPENLLLTSDGNLKITDFGLSRARSDTEALETISGTPQYMSPEQWKDLEAVTKQSDIYSFGIVLYEMLTGRQPFVANNFLELLKAHTEENPPDPKEFNPYLTDEIAQIPLKCLKKNPVDRYLHYDVLMDHLEKAYEQYAGEPYSRPDYDGIVSKAISTAEVMNRADSLFIIGKYTEAMKYYDMLLDLDPDSAKFWRRKAETMAKMDKFHEAEMYFAKTLSIEPSNLDAVIGHTKCLIKLGKKMEALGCCSPALAINQNHRELLKLKQMLIPEIAEKAPVGDHLTQEDWVRTGSIEPPTSGRLSDTNSVSDFANGQIRCTLCSKWSGAMNAFCPNCGNAFETTNEFRFNEIKSPNQFEQRAPASHGVETVFEKLKRIAGLNAEGEPNPTVSQLAEPRLPFVPPQQESALELSHSNAKNTPSEDITFYNTLDMPPLGSIVLDPDNIDPLLAQQLRDAGFRRDKDD